MKIYVLIIRNDDDTDTLKMPTTFGRRIRAYPSKARAKAYAKRFNATVVECEVNEENIV
jgi:hypothetical protein